MTFDYQVLQLSTTFYSDHPALEYPEILQKKPRPYTCLLIDLHYSYYICVPFRSEIHHSNAFCFQQSRRSRVHRSGLDYSKIAIINKTSYLDSSSAVIDQDEYRELTRHITKIVNQVNKYISTYIEHVTGKRPLSPREYNRKYQFSTLPYYHQELGLSPQKQ